MKECNATARSQNDATYICMLRQQLDIANEAKARFKKEAAELQTKLSVCEGLDLYHIFPL